MRSAILSPSFLEEIQNDVQSEKERGNVFRESGGDTRNGWSLTFRLVNVITS